MKKLLLVFVAITLSACAGPRLSGNTTAIIDSDEEMVKPCKMLGVVEATETYMISSQGATDKAKASIEEQAAKLGATNIVFKSKDNGMVPTPSVTLMYRAYKCSSTVGETKK